MLPKHETTVLIAGNTYTLSGDEGEEYIQRIALYINNRLDELRKSDNARQLNTRLLSVLLDINLADDYFKAKERSEALERTVAEKIKRIEELEQEAMQIQVKLDDLILEKAQMQVKIEALKNEASQYKEELEEYIEAFDSPKED